MIKLGTKPAVAPKVCIHCGSSNLYWDDDFTGTPMDVVCFMCSRSHRWTGVRWMVYEPYIRVGRKPREPKPLEKLMYK